MAWHDAFVRSPNGTTRLGRENMIEFITIDDARRACNFEKPHECCGGRAEHGGGFMRQYGLRKGQPFDDGMWVCQAAQTALQRESRKPAVFTRDPLMVGSRIMPLHAMQDRKCMVGRIPW